MVLTRDVRASMGNAAFDEAAARSGAVADACAKINLTLDVLARRDDGYHNVRSLVIGVGLADRVRCYARPDTTIALRCSDPALDGEGNLAVRAGRAFARYRCRELGLSIDLTKNIAVGAGMGGGSSDAATTLRLCNHLFSGGLDRQVLCKIGASLGSDVPLFFHLPAAIITGRGEQVEPVTLRWHGWVLLAFAGGPVSTAEVYRAWRPSDAVSAPTGLGKAIVQAATANEMSAMLSNHLEPAIFRVAPVVARAYEALQRLGCAPIRVSGAGSALYQLFDEKEAAQRAAEKIEGCGLGIRTNVVAAPTEEGRIVQTSKR